LRRLGIRWQDFLSMLSELGGEVDAWVSGELSWEGLIDSIKARLRGSGCGVGRRVGLLRWVRES